LGIGRDQGSYMRLSRGSLEDINVEVNKLTSVERLKELVEDEAEIPTAFQRMFLKGKELDDECEMSDYGVVKGSVFMVIRRK
jgi:hypothetical protein